VVSPGRPSCTHSPPNLLTQAHPDYFCNLDSNFMRLDHLQRPELNKGTVDFLVSDEYWAIEPLPNLNPSYASVGPSSKGRQHRLPQPMNYVFAFDVSVDAVKSGFLRSSCDALRATIYQETEEGTVCKLPVGSKIAIISYDRVINVYNLVGYPRTHNTYAVNNLSSEWIRNRGRARCARY
jgi:protein transport protein SEC24